MALQDLTPQLRTRLSRVERAVGLFVGLAVLLLMVGFIYYIHHTAQRKGWFLIKVPYFTYLSTGAGLKVGDPIRLMGFEAGQITRITAEDPSTPYNVYVEFNIREPYYGYLWTEGSKAKVATADLLGNRVIEVTKGTSGRATYREEPISGLFSKKKRVTGVWDDKGGAYRTYDEDAPPYYLLAEESPALGERLEKLANRVEEALPDILNLTNQLTVVLSNTANLTARADELIISAQPMVTNLGIITANLRDPKGSLGEWILPTNLHLQLLDALASADMTLTNANSSLLTLSTNLDKSLDNLASITSNLNVQVQQNTNILSRISETVVHADELMQGLRRHWLLRSAFKTNRAPQRTAPAGQRRQN